MLPSWLFPFLAHPTFRTARSGSDGAHESRRAHQSTTSSYLSFSLPDSEPTFLSFPPLPFPQRARSISLLPPEISSLPPFFSLLPTITPGVRVSLGPRSVAAAPRHVPRSSPGPSSPATSTTRLTSTVVLGVVCNRLHLCEEEKKGSW